MQSNTIFRVEYITSLSLLFNLQGEISALEAKLVKLREEDAEFTNAIKEEENKIESVKTKFSPQREALNKQQQEIERRENSLQEEFVS